MRDTPPSVGGVERDGQRYRAVLQVQAGVPVTDVADKGKVERFLPRLCRPSCSTCATRSRPWPRARPPLTPLSWSTTPIGHTRAWVWTSRSPDSNPARIKREQGDWDRATYEKETGVWAGGLSETWERIISMEIANPVVDRGTLEVHVTMVKLLARITKDDNKELQQSYNRCSLWAKRHDKDGALNYVAPTEAELESELALVKSWFERVKTYKN
jgi:hypothetical protein